MRAILNQTNHTTGDVLRQVDEVEILDANETEAKVRMPDGRQSTVSSSHQCIAQRDQILILIHRPVKKMALNGKLEMTMVPRRLTESHPVKETAKMKVSETKICPGD